MDIQFAFRLQAIKLGLDFQIIGIQVFGDSISLTIVFSHSR